MSTPSETAIPPRTLMRAAGTTTTPGIMCIAPPPPIPRLGGTTNGYHPWTGGEPTNATFTATRRILPRSAHCHHFHDPMEAHKQLKTKTTIQTTTSDLDTKKLFSRDEKAITIEELAELVLDHVEFCGMDLEFYLPDPQDPSHLCYILRDNAEFTPATVVKHFQNNSGLYDNYSTNNMDLSYKAIMSVVSDSIKQSIQPLLPPTLKYGPILWIYMVCEVRTASFQCIKSLKTQLETLKLCQTAGENVKTFTTRFLQICLDLGKNVPSDAPFTLNEQLSTSSIEQFRVKFMARSGAVSEWVT